MFTLGAVTNREDGCGKAKKNGQGGICHGEDNGIHSGTYKKSEDHKTLGNRSGSAKRNGAGEV